MLRLKDKIEANVTYADRAGSATMADSANAVAWDNVGGKPSTFPPSSHTHDDRYYTESEINTKLSSKVDNTEDGCNALMSKLPTDWSADPTDDTYFIRQDTAGEPKFGRLKFSTVWSYIKSKTDSAYAAKSHTHSYLPLSGGTLTGQVNFGSSSYYVKADGTANFKKVTGAVYNDYAEFFPRGEATEPGDIVALDLSSDHESYIKATATSKIVAGVHSDEYAMLIGGDKVDDGNYVEKNIEKYIPVSLCGRVYCKCVGKIHRGDTIVVSEIPGIGRAKLPNDYVENTQIVGYAVDEDMNEEIRRVRIRVKG